MYDWLAHVKLYYGCRDYWQNSVENVIKNLVEVVVTLKNHIWKLNVFVRRNEKVTAFRTYLEDFIAKITSFNAWRNTSCRYDFVIHNKNMTMLICLPATDICCYCNIIAFKDISSSIIFYASNNYYI